MCARALLTGENLILAGEGEAKDAVFSPFINMRLNSLGKPEADRPTGKYMNSSLAMNVTLYHFTTYASVISYFCA